MRNMRKGTFVIVGILALISLLTLGAVQEGSAADPIKADSQKSPGPGQ